MATRKVHKDATGLEVEESDELEALRLQVTALESKAALAEQNLTSERATHTQEIKRLQDLVSHLQHPAPLRAEPTTSRQALALIITKLEAVAIGGAAADLRQTVHAATAHLSHEDKQEVQGFAGRLRSAAEAVDQETATFFL